MQPVVAPDGTVLVVVASELFAVSPAGTTLWKWEGGVMMHALVVRGPQVFVVRTESAPHAPPMMGERQQFAVEVVALSLASGAVQWRREMPAMVSGIETAGDRVYVLAGGGGSMMNGMPGMGRGNRPDAGTPALTALDAATGTVLWTLSLE
jgi:outer membrane protein assembly factor BamB